jgi:hypothetical protein
MFNVLRSLVQFSRFLLRVLCVLRGETIEESGPVRMFRPGERKIVSGDGATLVLKDLKK